MCGLIGNIKDLLKINEHGFKMKPVSIDLSSTVLSCTFVKREFDLTNFLGQNTMVKERNKGVKESVRKL